MVVEQARGEVASEAALLAIGIAVGAVLYALLVLATQRDFVASFRALRRQA